MTTIIIMITIITFPIISAKYKLSKWAGVTSQALVKRSNFSEIPKPEFLI